MAGLRMSALGCGTASFGKYCDEGASAAAVHAALDCGITYFDTADSYGVGRCGEAERILARALGRHRADVVIATKYGTEFDGEPASASPRRARAAVEGSLKRLGTDHIDLFMLHVPDDVTPIADVIGVMHELAQAGKVRAVGCCNLSLGQLEAAAAADGAGFSFIQDEYSLLARSAESELFPYLSQRGAGFIAYAPLAQGLLTGKYTNNSSRWVVPIGSRLDQLAPAKASTVLDESHRAAVFAFGALCQQLNLPPAQVALAWALAQPTVTSVVPGATSASQVRHNAMAVELQLDDQLREEIARSVASIKSGSGIR